MAQFRKALMGATMMAGMGLAAAAQAQVTLYDANDLTVEASLSATAWSVNVKNPGFGLGNYNATSERRFGEINAFELAVQPGLYFAYDPGEFNLYSGLSVVATATRGNGDAFFGAPGGLVDGGGNFAFANTNTTHFQPEKVGLEEAYVGVRSGYMFSDWGLGPDIFDLSVGWQNFQIGRGFLIADGGADGGRRGGYYTGARTAFRDTAIFRFEGSPLRAEAFHLRNNQNAEHNLPGRTSLWGVNAEVFDGARTGGELTKEWEVGATYLRLYDADRGVAAARDDMNVLSVRAHGHFLRDLLPGLFLGAEYVQQWNDSNERDANGDFTRRLTANAGYVEAGYAYEDLEHLWSPVVTYRFAHFSGGTDEGNRSNTYDPLFYGATEGWGTWYMGEIISNYVLFNSNANVHMLKLTLTPSDEWEASLMGFHYRYDDLGLATAAGSRAAFNEVNLALDYAPAWAPWLSFSGLVGAARASESSRDLMRQAVESAGGPAGEAFDRTIYKFLFGASVSF